MSDSIHVQVIQTTCINHTMNDNNLSVHCIQISLHFYYLQTLGKEFTNF